MTALQFVALAAACLATLNGLAAPVDFTVKVNGPDGPLVNFPLAVWQKGLPQDLRAATNQEGVAHFTLDSTKANEIRVSAKMLPGPARESGKDILARWEQLRPVFQSLALPNYWEMTIPLDHGPVSRSVSIARGVKLTLQPVGLPRNTYPFLFLLVPGVRMESSELDAATGTLSRYGVPVNTASVGFLWFDERPQPSRPIEFALPAAEEERSQRSRAVAFAIPAAATDIDIGIVTIPPITFTSTINIRQLWTKTTDPRPIVYRSVGLDLDGVTLVSTDGLTILSDTLGPEDLSNREGTESAKTSVPAGTFYVVPGSFTANSEQMVVISRLRAGQDLSKRGLPMFTIAAGEEKTVEFNNVDVLNAIHAIEDGK